MSLMVKKCQFCGETRPHPKAHIWPRSLYRDEKGVPFKLVNLSGLERSKRSQTGIYDNALWCQTCEQLSNELDGYVARYLADVDDYLEPVVGDDGRPLLRPDGQVCVWTVKEIDPAKLQFFVLSVLWRASASKRRELIGFSLGPYEDRIRKLLRAQDIEELRHFPYLVRYELNEEMRGGFIHPARLRHDGVNFVRLIGGGLAFDVKISSQPLPDKFEHLASDPERPVVVMPYSLVETMEGRNIAKRVRRAHRLNASRS